MKNRMVLISTMRDQIVRDVMRILVIWNLLARTAATRLGMTQKMLTKMCGGMDVKVGIVMQP